ncbi:hypothetical protein GCM10009868_34780 [Terrabacter aerolatus]|uniref:Uncharacterized protein n=1 Tax=Terrabacter aerolatus TaxID=422442 RepID=A0A512CWF8_9MICO|nr:hypothetical protein [Terrabacter aerolatus]GEO28537.1 hypothetical protein TAE01_03470 [Terrabacter aerolatus]
MTVQFDAAVGRVRLDPATFDTLVDLATDAHPDAHPDARTQAPADARATDDLTATGVLVDGHPTEVLAPALAAVARPLARLETVVASRHQLLVHQGWLSLLSAVLADVGDGSYDFAGVATEFVPTTIARLVRLRPRTRLGAGSVTVTPDLLDGLLDPDDGRRARAADALGTALASDFAEAAGLVRDGAWCFWSAVVSWAPPGRSVRSDADLVSRRVSVLDTTAGMLALEASGPPGADRLSLVPTTPTDVWFLLSSILPSDADLGADAADDSAHESTDHRGS